MTLETSSAPASEDRKLRIANPLAQRPPLAGSLPGATGTTALDLRSGSPLAALRRAGLSPADRIYTLRRAQKWRRRFIALLVIMVPTLLAAVYCYALAAPMYLSSSRFAIYGQGSDAGSSSIVGKIMQSTGGAGSFAMMDGFAVRDYLSSLDALKQLDSRVGFVSRMQKPHGDFLLSLAGNESDERLLDFYRRVVNVRFNMAEGVVSLDVYGYKPEDAHAIAQGLTDLAGEFSNNMNRQWTEETVRAARESLERAEKRMADSRTALANWRKENSSLDVEADAKMIMTIVGQLEAQLSESRAQLSQLQLNEAFNSPMRRVLEDRISALTKQIEAENARLTGSTTNVDASVVSRLVDYQGLVLEQEFASKSYEGALQTLNSTSAAANVQQKFIATIVAPNMPGDAAYPSPAKIIPLTLIVSIFAYLLGSLAFSAMRDSARA